MARKLGDVLHFFLDDVRPHTPADPGRGSEAPADPPPDPRARGQLERQLRHLEPPLELLDAVVPCPSGCLAALAKEPHGRGVVVLRAAGGASDPELLSRGLAQLDWLAEAEAALPLRQSLSGEPARLVLIAARFSGQVRLAARDLTPDRVRLVRDFSAPDA